MAFGYVLTALGSFIKIPKNSDRDSQLKKCALVIGLEASRWIRMTETQYFRVEVPE